MAILLTGSTLTLAGSSVTVDSGVTATISSTVAGTAGLVKNGQRNTQSRPRQHLHRRHDDRRRHAVCDEHHRQWHGHGASDRQCGRRARRHRHNQGDVTSSGTLAPGSTVGTLHIGGTYSQAAGGRLEIELASPSNHDELAVTGAATLAGTLAVSLIGGFMPKPATCSRSSRHPGSVAASFANANLPTLAGGLVWNVNYGANSVTLSVALPGDFNDDGTVDAADYVVWRKTDGTQIGYDTWRAHFGETAGERCGGLALPGHCT